MAFACFMVLPLLTAISSLALGAEKFNLTSIANTSLNEGDNLTLRCEEALSTKNSTQLSYVWSRNGSLLSNSSLLFISSVTLQDSGEYTCIVSLANFSESITVLVTVSTPPAQGDDLNEVTVIAVSVLVGTVGLVFVGLLLIVWLAVNRASANIAVRSQRLKERRKSVASQRNELLTLEKRSLSVGHSLGGGISRKNSTFEDPYDRNLSRSTEQLLSGADNTVHPPTVDNLDYDLHLDEQLFESGKKIQSDTNLSNGQTLPTHRQLKQLFIDNLSKIHRQQSDLCAVFKPPLSQHSSCTNSASDLGDDGSDNQSQSSSRSAFKNVSFDLNDSGIATESSTPATARERVRRFSAPDVKFVGESIPRRDSAPGGLVSKSVSDDQSIADDTSTKNDPSLEPCSYSKVSSIVSLLTDDKSNSNMAKSAVAHSSQHSHVVELRERFQRMGEEGAGSEPHFRTRSVSRLVSERTKQLLLKNKPESDVAVSSPGRLVGFSRNSAKPSMLSSVRAHRAEEEDAMADSKPSSDEPSSQENEEEYDRVFEEYQQKRMCGLNLPFFSTPVSVVSPSGDDSDSDSDDETLVAPLKPTSRVSNISPFGRGMVGSKLLGLPVPHTLKGESEFFVKITPSRQSSRKNSASRLTVILEESPQGSATSLSTS